MACEMIVPWYPSVAGWMSLFLMQGTPSPLILEGRLSCYLDRGNATMRAHRVVYDGRCTQGALLSPRTIKENSHKRAR
jgi:hypothetical protein